MSFLDSYGTKRRLGQLAAAWERLRPYVEAEPAGAELDAPEEEFLNLKRDIGQALAVLQEDFGSSNMNREAEQGAAKIRALLTNVPTLASLKAQLSRDSEGVQRAWHAVFLTLSELQGAKPPKPVKTKSAILIGGMTRMPMSGDPRLLRRRWHLVRGIGQIVTLATKTVAFVAVLAIALFFAERAGLFGRTDAASGQRAAPANAIAAAAGQAWQSAQDWARATFPDVYGTMKGYYARDPGTGVIILVMLAGIFVGYLLFVRSP
jgi:hypothetical protein